MRDSPRLGCQFASYPEEVQLRVWGGRGRCGKIAIERGKSRPPPMLFRSCVLKQTACGGGRNVAQIVIGYHEMHDDPLTKSKHTSNISEDNAV